MTLPHRPRNLAIIAFTFALGLGMASGMAYAGEWYLGAGVGQSSMQDVNCNDPTLTSCSLDKTDTAWKVYGGFQFLPYAAVEFGYVDLGEVTSSGTDVFFGPFNAAFKTTAFDVALVGTLPLGNVVALQGKIGAARWDVDDSGTIGGIYTAVNESGTDLVFGVGARFNVMKNLAIRAEWERFKNVGKEDTSGQFDIDLLSVNLIATFK